MRDQIEERLKTLKVEFKTGQEVLTDLEARQVNVRTTLARISGAIQVLEELLGQQFSDISPSENAEAPETMLEAAGSGHRDGHGST